MRIMDIEAMKREASETQISKLNQGNISPVSAPTAGTGKTTQEVAKKIAKAAGVKSKSMFLEMGLSDQPSNNHQVKHRPLPPIPQRLSYIAPLDGSLSPGLITHRGRRKSILGHYRNYFYRLMKAYIHIQILSPTPFPVRNTLGECTDRILSQRILFCIHNQIYRRQVL